MKAFLLSYNPLVVGQPAMTAYLDTRREVKNWYMPYLGAVLLITDDATTPSGVSSVLRLGFPTLLFTIAPLDPNSTDGWMPELFWGLIRQPAPSGRWDVGPTFKWEDFLKALPPPPKESGPLIPRKK